MFPVTRLFAFQPFLAADLAESVSFCAGTRSIMQTKHTYRGVYGSRQLPTNHNALGRFEMLHRKSNVQPIHTVPRCKMVRESVKALSNWCAMFFIKPRFRYLSARVIVHVCASSVPICGCCLNCQQPQFVPAFLGDASCGIAAGREIEQACCARELAKRRLSASTKWCCLTIEVNARQQMQLIF